MRYFEGKRFSLSVHLDYTPSALEVEFLGALFERVSRALHTATGGVHSIGHVFFTSAPASASQADIRIFYGSEVRNSTGAALWWPGTSIQYGQHQLPRPALLLHELSHYLYALGDEYEGTGKGRFTCTHAPKKDATEDRSACIMDNRYDTGWSDGGGGLWADWNGFWPAYSAAVAQGGALEFRSGITRHYCHAGNHVTNPTNEQQSVHGESCWHTMTQDTKHGGIPYHLVLPAGDPALLADSPAPDPVQLVELVPASRYVLVLDRSASMTGTKFDELKLGAHFWVDYVQSPEELGIISFDDVPMEDVPIAEVPSAETAANAWRNDRHAVIDALAVGGNTALGDALRLALDRITAAGLAANTSIVLFSDGLQTAGTESIATVLPDLVAAGVTVSVIGLGDDHDASLLESLSLQTNGIYTGIPALLDPAMASSMIRDLMIAAAARIRPDAGLTAFEDLDPGRIDIAAAPFDWSGAAPAGFPEAAFEFPVDVTAGSTQCTIGISVQDADTAFDMELLDPSGTSVTRRTDLVARKVAGARPYRFFAIDSPTPAGRWRLRVSGSALGMTRFRVFASETHPRIRVSHVLERMGDPADGRFRLQVFLRVPELVPRARASAWIGTASGGWKHEALDEQGDARDQHTSPPVYSRVIETGSPERRIHTVALDVRVGAGTFDVEHLSPTQRRADRALRAATLSVRVPDVRRRLIFSFVSGPRAPVRGGLVPGYNPTPPRVPRDQRQHVRAWRAAHPR